MNDERSRLLIRRVEALTSTQREALADALAQRGVARASDRLSDRLIAFVAAQGDGGRPSDKELLEFLSARVPQYMVPARIMLMERLPRTAAGKMDRLALAKLAAEAVAEVPVRTLVAPRTELELKLAAIWCDVLNVSDVGVDDDFFELGGDSLLSIRVIARAGREGIRVSPERFFERPTIRQMAAIAVDRAVSQGAVRVPINQATTDVPDAAETGKAPLTPIQHWFLQAIGPQNWWNQSYLLDLPWSLSHDTMREIIGRLVEHHPALRLRLVDANGWRQEFHAQTEAVPLRIIDLRDVAVEEYPARIEAESEREQAGMQLASGNLFRCLLFEGRKEWHRLLLVAHHVVVDGVSWNIIMEDLAALLGQSANGEPLRLPVRTGGARSWAIALTERAEELTASASADYWLVLGERHTSLPAAWITNSAADRMQDAVHHSVALDAAQTQSLLRDTSQRLGVTPQAVLLAALLLAWRDAGGGDTLILDIEGHGRNLTGVPVDVSRVVGWFTTVFPVELVLPRSVNGAGPAQVVKSVQSVLDTLPLRGAAHGLHRYLSGNESTRSRLAALPARSMLFNFLGTHDVARSPSSELRIVDEPRGRTRDPDAPRAYPIELNCFVAHGALTVVIEYSRMNHDQGAIQSFGNHLRKAFDTLAVAGTARFGVAAFDAATLGAIAASLKGKHEA